MSSVRGRVRFEKRLDVAKRMTYLVPLMSVGAALVVGAILLLATGHNPIDTYHKVFSRGFGSRSSLSGTIGLATPILFTGLAAAAAFRMGLFNIGGEGQLIMGAVGASGVAIALSDQAAPVIFIAMVVAGMVCGGLYALVPGFLKARFKTSEIITSLMMNYIAAIVLNYLIFNSTSYWRDPKSKGFPTGKAIGSAAQWNEFTVSDVVVPLGFVVASIAAAVVWGLYKKTRFGFEVNVVGDSPVAARYAGVNTRRKVLTVMGISGALAGLGGASDIGDFRHVLDAKGLSQAGYGYTGIVVAALARLNPLAVIVVAVVMGGLTNAGYALQGPDFPSGLVGTLQGLILFCTVAGEVLTRYRVRINRRTVAPAPSGPAEVSAA